MGTYGLDPANYYTLPGYAWDMLLKDTKIELQLLTDPDTYLFIEKGLRGGDFHGISTIRRSQQSIHERLREI